MKSRTNIKETTNERGGVSSPIQAKPWADVSEARCLLFSYTKGTREPQRAYPESGVKQQNIKKNLP